MTNEVTLDVDSQQVIDALEDTGDYRVFEDSTEGMEAAIEWIKEEEFIDIDDLTPTVSPATRFILDRLGPDVIDYVCNIHMNAVVSNVIDNRFGQLDCRYEDIVNALQQKRNVEYLLGPIESTDIINHLESSIEAMVIRKLEAPTDAIAAEMARYMMEFDWGDELVIQLRKQGLTLERIIRVYLEQDHAEEVRAHDY